MRGWHRWMAALWVSLFLTCGARAQTENMRLENTRLEGAQTKGAQAERRIRDLGMCDMHEARQWMTLREVTTQPPSGPAQQALHLIPPPPVQYAPTPLIEVTPDPSGANFLAIRSEELDMRFWVRWDLQVVSIEDDGTTHPAGTCDIDPAFVQSFARPAPTR